MNEWKNNDCGSHEAKRYTFAISYMVFQQRLSYNNCVVLYKSKYFLKLTYEQVLASMKYLGVLIQPNKDFSIITFQIKLSQYIVGVLVKFWHQTVVTCRCCQYFILVVDGWCDMLITCTSFFEVGDDFQFNHRHHLQNVKLYTKLTSDDIANKSDTSLAIINCNIEFSMWKNDIQKKK